MPHAIPPTDTSLDYDRDDLEAQLNLTIFNLGAIATEDGTTTQAIQLQGSPQALAHIIEYLKQYNP